jgi:GNAT superfamily N-acetyltransferase
MSLVTDTGVERLTAARRRALADLLEACPWTPDRHYMPDARRVGAFVAEHLIREAPETWRATAVRDGVPRAVARAQRLTWDTAHFGVPCGRIDMLLGRPPVAAEDYDGLLDGAFGWRAAVDFVSCKVDVRDVGACEALARRGFRQVSTSVRFACPSDGGAAPDPDGIGLRSWTERDLPALQALVGRLYTLTRFHQDRRIPRETSDALQARWLVNCCRGLADRVTVAEVDGRIVGFVTCRLRPIADTGRQLGVIDLIGVAPGHQGRGLAGQLVADVRAWCHGRAATIEIETQLANERAMAAYPRLGFGFVAADHCFHSWRADR